MNTGFLQSPGMPMADPTPKDSIGEVRNFMAGFNHEDYVPLDGRTVDSTRYPELFRRMDKTMPTLTTPFINASSMNGPAVCATDNFAFMATNGTPGDILRSSDLLTWYRCNTSINWTVQWMQTVNGRIFASANDIGTVNAGGVLVSADEGVTWQNCQYDAAPSSYNFFNIRFGNGIYIAISSSAGGYGTNTRLYYTSTDGIKWTAQTFGSSSAAFAQNPRLFEFGNGFFYIMCANGLYRSANGIDWNYVGAPTTYVDSLYNDNFGKLIYMEEAQCFIITCGDNSANGNLRIWSNTFSRQVANISLTSSPACLVYASSRNTFTVLTSNSGYSTWQLTTYTTNPFVSNQVGPGTATTNSIYSANSMSTHPRITLFKNQILGGGKIWPTPEIMVGSAINSITAQPADIYENASNELITSGSTNATFTSMPNRGFSYPRDISGGFKNSTTAQLSKFKYSTALGKFILPASGTSVASGVSSDLQYIDALNLPQMVQGSSGYNAIATNNSGTWVAVPAGSVPFIWLSTDNCVTWTRHFLDVIAPGAGMSNVYSVVFGLGYFVISSNVGYYYTNNFTTWTLVPGSSGQLGYCTVFENNTLLLAGNSNVIWSSTNGTTWTSNTASTTSSHITDIAFGNGNYVAVALNGTLLTATNLSTWTSRTSGHGANPIYAVAYCNIGGTTPSFYTAGSTGWARSTSADASIWAFTTLASLHSITSDGTAVYMFGTNTNQRTVDGTTWQRSPVAITNTQVEYSTIGSQAVEIVYMFNKYWMLTGNGQIWSSDDLYYWTRITTIGITPTCMTAGNGLLVIAGAAGALQTSPDGAVWTTRTSGFGATAITRLAYLNNLFLAFGTNTVSYSATGAATWTVGSGLTGTVNSVTWNGNRYVTAIGTTACFTSTNGATWANTGTYTVATHFVINSGSTLWHYNNGAGASVNLCEMDTAGVITGTMASGTSFPATTGFGQQPVLVPEGPVFPYYNTTPTHAYFLYNLHGSGFGLSTGYGTQMGGESYVNAFYVNDTFIIASRAAAGDNRLGVAWAPSVSTNSVSYIGGPVANNSTIMNYGKSTFANGTYMMSTQAGHVYFSTDLKTRSRKLLPISRVLDMGYYLGRWVVLQHKMLSWSTDGTNWTTIQLPELMVGMTASTTTLLIFGNGTNVLTSNFSTFDFQQTSHNILSAIWDGKNFTAVGTGIGNPITSPDGIVWTAIPQGIGGFPSNNSSKILYNPSFGYAIFGYGSTQIRASITGNQYGMLSTTRGGDGVHVLTANGLYTFNGVSLTHYPTVHNNPRDIAPYSGGVSTLQWESVYSNINKIDSYPIRTTYWAINETTTRTSYTSPPSSNTFNKFGDELIHIALSINNWFSSYPLFAVQTGIATTVIPNMAYGNGRWLIGSDGTNQCRSYTGSAGTALGGVATLTSSVFYLKDKFIAFRAGGNHSTFNDTLTTATTQTGITQTYLYAAFGNNVFVAAANTPAGRIAWSIDAINWTEITLTGVLGFVGLVFVDGKFIALDTAGNIISSVDGINWSTAVSLVPTTCYNMSYDPTINLIKIMINAAMTTNGSNLLFVRPDAFNAVLPRVAVSNGTRPYVRAR